MPQGHRRTGWCVRADGDRTRTRDAEEGKVGLAQKNCAADGSEWPALALRPSRAPTLAAGSCPTTVCHRFSLPALGQLAEGVGDEAVVHQSEHPFLAASGFAKLGLVAQPLFQVA